jgi:hypothetical protein
LRIASMLEPTDEAGSAREPLLTWLRSIAR